MEPQLPQFTEEKFLNRRNVLGILAVGVLLLAVPFAVNLLKETTFFKSRAGGGGVIFAGENIVDCPGFEGQCAKDSKVTIQFMSPFGSPAGPTEVPTPVPTAGPIATAGPTVPPATSAPTPTSAPASAALNIVLTGPASGAVGQALAFTVDAAANKLARVQVFAAKTNGLAADTWCPAGKIQGAQKEWCLLEEKKLSDSPISSYSLPVNFTPSENGVYYISANVIDADNKKCGANPWGNPNDGLWSNCPSAAKQISVTGGAATPVNVTLTGPASGTVGQSLSFTASAGSSAGNLAKLQVFAAKTDRSAASAWCTGTAKGEWCPLAEIINLSDSPTGSYSLPVNFTPRGAGDYYIVANVTSTTSTVRCTGNPWDRSGWLDCRSTSLKLIRVR